MPGPLPADRAMPSRTVRPWLALLATLGACQVRACGPASVAPPDDPRPVLALSVDVPFAGLTIPDTSRPHAPDPTEVVPLTGWTRGDRVGSWRAPHPIRTRNLYFMRPSPGMRVTTASGGDVAHEYLKVQGGQADEMWGYDETGVTLMGERAGAPQDAAYTFTYPRAVQRERRLNLATSGLSADDFVRATVQVGDHSEISRQGLLLPAPAEAGWEVTLPEGAVLSFEVGMVPPEWRDAPPSDGAVATVTWTPQGGAPVELYRARVDVGPFERVTVDLSAWSGTAGHLAFQTEPGPDARFDYVFFADPVVAPHRDTPRRVFLVFVDTLRPDHLGAYGYPRETSPALDAIAARGVRFDQARSIAPWTLPSARTMVTGNQPERYATSESLPTTLRAAGFATGMFAGNLYLGPNFDMHRGWGMHHIDLLPHAQDQLDKALAWLEGQEGRDVLMLLHLMDPHLPYKEPPAYREHFASVPRPPAIRTDLFHLPAVKRARPADGKERQYFLDRYDANIRYADDQLARLYEHVRPTDLVVFVSDHGEEFWDHGDFEHGHTLFEELLRVPMVMAGAGLPVGHAVDDPVSLLDVTPTILDVLGLLPEDHDRDGTSLLPAMRGDEAARRTLATRALAVGRPLYGAERWGVIDGPHKYTTHAGEESLFDLRADPTEKRDLRDQRGDLAMALRGRMGEALDREPVVALRLSNRIERRVLEDMTVTVKVPGGVTDIWTGNDPTEHSLACPSISEDGTTLTVTWPAPWRGAREVFAITARPLEEIANDLEIVATAGEATLTPAVPDDQPFAPGGRRTVTRGWVGGRSFAIGVAVVPTPVEGQDAVSGYDAETSGGLQAMGYVVGDEPPGEDPGDHDEGHTRALGGCP